MATPGSPKDVHRLVDDHYVGLYRYAFRLTGAAADAEDLTQEAFCKAQVNLGQLRDAERARPWLYRILRNCYLHRVRSDRQANCVSLNGVGDVAGPGTEELTEIDPEQLQKALGDLPEAYRTPIILYYFEDFSYRDIAEQMELPLGTVMSRLARGKCFLRRRLKPPEPPVAAAGHRLRRATDGL
jgi:RNA polymerase sigma-70 factor (ECF subfamily)